MKGRNIFITIITVGMIVVTTAGFHSDRQSRIMITKADEPGEPLVVSGVVLTDMGSPIQGAVVKVHHADAGGVYNENRLLPARLKGSMVTDSLGRFEFRTIRPGSYPGTRALAHIHCRVSASGFRDRSLEIVFKDDPNLTAENRESAERENYMLLRPVELSADRVWQTTAAITLRRDE